MAVHNDEERKSLPSYLGPALFLGGAYLYTHNKRGEKLLEYEYYLADNIEKRMQAKTRSVHIPNIGDFLDNNQLDGGLVIFKEYDQKETGVGTFFDGDPYAREKLEFTSHFDALNNVLDEYKEQYLQDPSIVSPDKLEKIKASKNKMNDIKSPDSFINNEQKFNLYKKIAERIKEDAAAGDLTDRQLDSLRLSGIMPDEKDFQTEWQRAMMTKFAAEDAVKTENGLMLKTASGYVMMPSRVAENTYSFNGLQFYVPDSGASSDAFLNNIEYAANNKRSFFFPSKMNLVVGGTILKDNISGMLPLSDTAKANPTARQVYHALNAYDNRMNDPGTDGVIKTFDLLNEENIELQSQSKTGLKSGVLKLQTREQYRSFMYGIDGLDNFQRHNQSHIFNTGLVVPNELQPKEYIKGIQSVATPTDKSFELQLRMEDRKFNENRFNGFFLMTYDADPISDGQGSKIKGTYGNTGVYYNGRDVFQSGDHIKLSLSSAKTTIVGEVGKDELGLINPQLVDMNSKPGFVINGSSKQTVYGRTEKGMELLRAIHDMEYLNPDVNIENALLEIGIDKENVDNVLKTYNDFKQIATFDNGTGQVIALDQTFNGTTVSAPSITRYQEINATLKRAGSNMSEIMNESLQKHFAILEGDTSSPEYHRAIESGQKIAKATTDGNNYFLNNLFAVSKKSTQIVGHTLNSSAGLMEHSSDYFNFGMENMERYSYFAVSDSTRLQMQQSQITRQHEAVDRLGNKVNVNLDNSNQRKWNFVVGMLNPNIEEDINNGTVKGMNVHSFPKIMEDYSGTSDPALIETKVKYNRINDSTRKLMMITDVSKINYELLTMEEAIKQLQDKGHTITQEDKNLIKQYIDNPEARADMVGETYKEWVEALEDAEFVEKNKRNHKVINFADVESGSRYAKSTVLDLTDMATTLSVNVGKNNMVYDDNFKEQLELFYKVMHNINGVSNDVSDTFRQYVSKVFGSKTGVISNVADQLGISSKISESRNFISDYKSNFKKALKELEFSELLIESYNLDKVDQFNDNLEVNDLILHSGQDKRSSLQKKTTQVLGYRSPFINHDSADLLGLKIISDQEIAEEFIERSKNAIGDTNFNDQAREIVDKKYKLRERIAQRKERRLAKIDEIVDVVQETRKRMHDNFINNTNAGIKVVKSDVELFREQAEKVLKERDSKLSLDSVTNAYANKKNIMTHDVKNGVFKFDMSNAVGNIENEYKEAMNSFMNSNYDKKIRQIIVNELAGKSMMTHIGITENMIASADFDGDQIKAFFIDNRKLEIEHLVTRINNLPDTQNTFIQNGRNEMRRIIKEIESHLNNGSEDNLSKVPKLMDDLKKHMAVDADVFNDTEITDTLLYNMQSSDEAVSFYHKLYRAGEETIEEARINKLRASLVTNIQEVDFDGKVSAVSVNKSLRSKGDLVTTKDNLTQLDISKLSEKERHMIKLELLMNDEELDNAVLYTINKHKDIEADYNIKASKAGAKAKGLQTMNMSIWNSETQEYEHRVITRSGLEEAREQILSRKEKVETQLSLFKEQNAMDNLDDIKKAELNDLNRQLEREQMNLKKFEKGEKANAVALASAGATMQRSLPEYYKGNIIPQNIFAYFKKEFAEGMGEIQANSFLNYVAYHTQEGLDVKRADSKRIVLDFSHNFSKTVETAFISRDASKRAEAVEKIFAGKFEANVAEIVNYIEADVSILESADVAKKKEAFFNTIVSRTDKDGQRRRTISAEDFKDLVANDKTGFTSIELKRDTRPGMEGKMITVGDMIQEEIISSFDEAEKKNHVNYLAEIYEKTRGMDSESARKLAEDEASSRKKNLKGVVTKLMNENEKQLREVYNNTLAIYATNPTLSVSDMIEQKGTIFHNMRHKSGGILKANDVVFMSSLERISKEFAETGIIHGQIGTKQFKLNSPLTMVGLGALGAFALMNTNNDPTRATGTGSRNFARNINKVYEDKLHETQYQLYEQTKQNPIFL